MNTCQTSIKPIYYCSVVVAHILGPHDKHEITTLVSSELTKRGKVTRTNTDLSNTYRRSKLKKLSCILLVRIVYPHFETDFVHFSLDNNVFFG